jgi:hypothetical protein
MNKVLLHHQCIWVATKLLSKEYTQGKLPDLLPDNWLPITAVKKGQRGPAGT